MKSFSYTLNQCFFWATLLIQTNLVAQNIVSTYAGTGNPGFDNGPATEASFDTPFGIAIDQDGNVYVVDGENHAIRKISTEGEVSTFAGSGIAGYADGPAAEAQFNSPINICFGLDGSMYVSDFLNQRIRKIDTEGMVSTFAGSGSAGYVDGQGTAAWFNYPRGIVMDDTGNLYIGDSWNHRIRKITPDGTVTTWAGGGLTTGVQSVGALVDDVAEDARFYTPTELSIDQYNNIFVADAYNHRIRKVDANQVVSTIAGSGGAGPDAGGFQDGPGDEARFNVPTACHVTLEGDIFVGDGSNHRIRRIDPMNEVSTFAGVGIPGFEDGLDTEAKFDFPRGIVKDYDSNRLYVVDFNNHAIRSIQLETISSNEHLNRLAFNFYPNPVKEDLILSNSTAQQLEIKIIDLNGKVIIQKNTAEPTIVLETMHLQSGFYFVNIKSEKGVYTGKIFKIQS